MIISAIYKIPKVFSILDVFIILIVILLYYSLHHDSGLVKSFLSYKFFTPISKAGLSIYLIVSYFQFGIHERLLEPQEIQNEFQFVSFFEI